MSLQLMWLVGGAQITPREYLETALRQLDGSGPAIEAKNQVPSWPCHY